jgi:hypothetical protein
MILVFDVKRGPSDIDIVYGGFLDLSPRKPKTVRVIIDLIPRVATAHA